MAKQATKVSKKGEDFEHVALTDDSFLPSPDDLIKLNQLGPDFMKWFQDYISNEQKHRENLRRDYAYLENERLRLVESTSKKAFSTDIIVLVISFLVVCSSFGISAFLISKGLNIQGTIFAGATLVLLVGRFLNFKRRTQNADAKKKSVNQ